MIVFKLCLKIIKRNWIFIIIYLVVFAIIMTMMMASYQKNPTSFSNTKTSVAFFDYDNTEFTVGLKEYLEEYAVFKDIKIENLDDAFFFRDIQMIVEIPEGFTASITAENPVTIKTRTVPDSATAFSFSHALNKYISLASVYLKNEIPTDNLSETLKTELSKTAEIDIDSVEKDDYDMAGVFFNYFAYILIALIITAVGQVMLSFKPIDIKRRNSISYISNRKMNLILIAVNFFMGIAFCLVLDVLGIIMFPDVMFKSNGLLLILNSLIFTMTAISLAYLISVLFNSGNVVGALSTICSLGFSFLTGVFIPQFLLDKNLLMIARVIPSYWYVLANDSIVALSNPTIESLGSVLVDFAIQIAFALAFIGIALAVSRKRQRAEQ